MDRFLFTDILVQFTCFVMRTTFIQGSPSSDLAGVPSAFLSVGIREQETEENEKSSRDVNWCGRAIGGG